MKNIIRYILTVSLSAYFILGAVLYIFQDSFLYFPSKDIKNSYTKRVFISENESISTTVLNANKNKAIIYFGGNAENVDNNADTFTKIFKNYTVYLVKYRGYGASTGKARQKAFYLDALSIYDEIQNNYQDISIIGRSLGTGIATYLASKRDVLKLALITPFDSIQNVAQGRYPMYPMSFLLKDKYNSLKNVPKIKAQTLILIAQNDKIIKRKQSLNLAKAFLSSQLTLHIIKNTNHNTISNNSLYYTYLKNHFK